jgi:HD superfamily phosphohydrolase
MPDHNPTPGAEELGYFYDTIHGRVALEDLPEHFRPALKSALSSKSLDRLKRISQLGHTSVSFFSATHTRFSHAIGTMLVMNKLFRHVREHGLSKAVFDEVGKFYAPAVAKFYNECDMVYCHLLLAGLYQDVGELPFQKVTSLYFAPIEADVNRLVNYFTEARPREWTTKKTFSVLSLMNDSSQKEIKDGFARYDLKFLAYLMTGDGAPVGTKAISALLQLVDGVIDADRLDYVYRDASATIGSLSRPSTVLESIVSYEPGRVIVNDPRPVTDFLSTRMRLWTFVYSSADVRFRQTLLKTVLDGRWDHTETIKAFEMVELDPKLPHLEFMKLDDISLMNRIDRLDPNYLEHYRQQARRLLLDGTLDYECRVLRRGKKGADAAWVGLALPDDLFFDLLSDHGHHQLYRPDTVFVRQALTSKIADPDIVRLEESAGAFSPLFTGQNSAMIVPNGYYLFLPKERPEVQWLNIDKAIATDSLFQILAWEDARRGLVCPPDTRNKEDFPDFKNASAISISYCSSDFPTVVRIVRELNQNKRRYRLFLRQFDGTGGTSEGNSLQLVDNAESVLAVVSTDYLERAIDGASCISIEVRKMHDRAKDIPVVAVGVDERNKLNAVQKWDWGLMNEDWRGKQTVIPNDLPLRNATEETLRGVLKEALKSIDQWKKQP